MVIFLVVFFVAISLFGIMTYLTKRQPVFRITPLFVAADVACGLLLNLLYALTFAHPLIGSASDPFWFYFVGSVAILSCRWGVRTALWLSVCLVAYDVVIQRLASEQWGLNDVGFIGARFAWLVLALVAARAIARYGLTRKTGAVVSADSEMVRCAMSLTTREREVLTLVASGRLDKEVATELGISVRTVHTYLDRIRQKINLRRRPELVRFAIAAGFLDLSDGSPT